MPTPSREASPQQPNYISSFLRASYSTATSFTLQICPLPSLACLPSFSSSPSMPQEETCFPPLLRLDDSITTVLWLWPEKDSVVRARLDVAVSGCFVDFGVWRRRVRRTGTLAAIIVIADSAVLQMMRTTPWSFGISNPSDERL